MILLENVQSYDHVAPNRSRISGSILVMLEGSSVPAGKEIVLSGSIYTRIKRPAIDFIDYDIVNMEAGEQVTVGGITFTLVSLHEGQLVFSPDKDDTVDLPLFFDDENGFRLQSVLSQTETRSTISGSLSGVTRYKFQIKKLSSLKKWGVITGNENATVEIPFEERFISPF